MHTKHPIHREASSRPLLRPPGNRAQPLGQLHQPVEPRFGSAPGAVDDELVVGAQAGGAVEAFDVGDEAEGVGEVVLVEGDERAFEADVGVSVTSTIIPTQFNQSPPHPSA